MSFGLVHNTTNKPVQLRKTNVRWRVHKSQGCADLLEMNYKKPEQCWSVAARREYVGDTIMFIKNDGIMKYTDTTFYG